MLATLTKEEPATARPEFFRLPKQAAPAKPARNGKPAKPARPPECDPYFGFSRSFYYEGERRGWWKLVRIRDKNKDRGVTLIPYSAVAAFVREAAKKGAESKAEFESERGDYTEVRTVAPTASQNE